METISRKEAKEKGLKRYFTGEPCKHGHIGERFTSNWACSICYAERYQENKDTIAEKNRRYRKENPIPCFVRGSLSRVTSDWKGSREEAEKLLGYTYEQLQQRIESQFKEGMSWENRSEWHIDHIKPIKAFLDEGITDPKIINALDNLQPLWAHENLSKGAKHDE